MDSALKALAEPRRRDILRLVWATEMPASQIAAQFEDITRSAVSQHLGVLRGARLVTERRDGTKRLYRANHVEMARLRNYLDDFWTESLDRLRELAEAAQDPPSESVQTPREPRRTSKTTKKGPTDG
jgi:DNA-binding transcriptional ArsR family regulator